MRAAAFEQEVIMIRNQWYAILESSEVKPGKPVGVTRLGEKMVLWRTAKGEVACLVDLCPHRGVALSIGKLMGDGDCVQCPFHGFEYDATGQCTLVPANGKTAPAPKALKARAYPARDAHGFIWIWWGEPRPELPPIRYFEIDDTFSHYTVRDHWATHYSRAIENQLDVVHLPFIHRNTIGRGNQTLVDGPVARWASQTPDFNRLDVWYTNRVDDGTPARKPSEMPEPAGRSLLQFIFPNVWQNFLGDKLRIVIAFAPIDDENTMMYIRAFQRIVRTPVLRTAFNWVNAVGNFVIERQDRRPVITQRPKRSALNMDEKLIPGDNPIALYRRRREELIRAAQTK